MKPSKKDLSEKQRIAYETYYKNNCSEIATCKALGISSKSLRQHLYYCARKGLKITPDDFCEQAPAGWGMFMSTIQSGADGEIKQRWDRVKPIEENSEQLFEYLKTRVPVNPIKIKKPTNADPKIQLEWTLADLHFGMLAWGKETGDNYDLKISRSLLLDSASAIFARAGKVKETVLVLMGDNFHADFFDAKTEKGQNSLDVDIRFPKMILTGAETFISAVEICLQFSEKVKIIVLYGNHDKQTSSMLPILLHYNFKNEPRVSVDLSPAKQHYNYWGCVATVYHHGDGTNKTRLCGDFTRTVAMSGKSGIQYFYAKQAHLHKELIEDINGVTYEIVPSPVASDAFAAGGNFVSKRATVATMYHKELGELDRYSITPGALKLMKRR